MTDKEIIPLSSAQKLDILFMHNEVLARNKKLQQEIIDWAEDMLEEARTEWSNMRASILDSIITCDRKMRQLSEDGLVIKNMLRSESILRIYSKRDLSDIMNKKK